MSSKEVARLFILVLTAGAAACGDRGVEVTTDGDDAAEMEDVVEEEVAPCDPFPAPETGGEGADMSRPVPSGEARAGRITDPALVPMGPKAWAETGDFLIRNSRVGFVIEDTSGEEGLNSHGYNPFGGEIVYADLWTEDGPAGRNMMGELFFGLGIQLIDPETVTVLSDGSDGGDAVVRVTGPLTPMPLLDVAAGDLLDPFPFRGELIIDYSLGGDADFLRITFHVRNPNTRLVRIMLPLFGAIMGDGLRLMTPAGGFDDHELGGSHEFYGFVGDAISYAALDGRGGGMEYVMEESGVLVASQSALIEVAACGETTAPAVDILVAAGGAEPLFKAVRRARGRPEPPQLGGTVTIPGPEPAAGAWVHVLAGDGSYATSALCDAAGAYSVGLEPGDYEIYAELEGYSLEGPLTAAMGSADQTLDMEFEPSGVLGYTVTDGTSPLPVKIIVVPDTPPASLPDPLGPVRLPNGAVRYIFDADGQGEVLLPPGGYTVTAMRGFYYDYAEEEVTITASGTEDLSMTLTEVVDRTGYMCADLHQHSWSSPDSNIWPEVSVASNVAEGLDLIVSTDHDWINNYQPQVEAMGLEGWTRAFAGSEVTSYEYGHFNAYPLTIREDMRNNGSVDHYYLTPEEFFPLILADPMHPVLQINHPRSGGLGGYFDYVRLDPETCRVEVPEAWSTLFTAIEVFNDDDLRDPEEAAALQDWFGLLNCGHRMTGTGTSDSHSHITSERGYVRSCMYFGHNVPGNVADAELGDAVRSMNVLISGGPFINVDVDGVTMGGVASAPGGNAEVNVLVQAPEWMNVERMRIFVSGLELDPVVLDESVRDPLNPVIRFDDAVTVSTGGGDGFVVIIVEGDEPLTPVASGRYPFAVTNPVFLDADGDGVFSP